MEPQNNSPSTPLRASIWQHVWHFIRIPIYVIVALFIAIIIFDIPHYIEKTKTQETINKIQAQKLTLKDVTGENLPPEPDPAVKDATVAGVDANSNGIRDDVELAIFKEYPNSAKTRAVLLQYALALQMEVTQPIINIETATALAEEESRAGGCVADTLVPRKSPESSRDYSDVEKINAYTGFVEKKQFNTAMRKESFTNFNKHIGSFELQSSCDIDPSNLSN